MQPSSPSPTHTPLSKPQLSLDVSVYTHLCMCMSQTLLASQFFLLKGLARSRLRSGTCRGQFLFKPLQYQRYIVYILYIYVYIHIRCLRPRQGDLVVPGRSLRRWYLPLRLRLHAAGRSLRTALAESADCSQEKHLPLRLRPQAGCRSLRTALAQSAD